MQKQFKTYSHTAIANRIWFYTVLSFAAGAYLYFVFTEWNYDSVLIGIGVCIAAFVCAVIGSLPALITLHHTVYRIERLCVSVQQKFIRLLLLLLSIAFFYGSAAAFIGTSFNYNPAPWQQFFEITGTVTAILFAAICMAVIINYKCIIIYFSPAKESRLLLSLSNQSNTTNMEQHE